MLEFAGFMLDFAVLYSLKCSSLHVSVYRVSESPRGCTGSTQLFATPADPAATARADLEHYRERRHVTGKVLRVGRMPTQTWLDPTGARHIINAAGAVPDRVRNR